MNKILLVEDNENLGYALKSYLELRGFELRWAKNGLQGLQFFQKYPFDLCLLDVMMPEKDGFSLAQDIRRKNARIPLLFLTAKSLKADVLKGFALGADDYIVKPIDEEELVARINAVLRRAEPEPVVPVTYQIGSYTFDVDNLQLQRAGIIVQMTEKEAQLLQLLCQHENKLLSREDVLKSLWNQNDYFTRRSMDVFISRLRKYLADDPAIQIQNIYGSGFIFKIGNRDNAKPSKV
ncbi:MAG TPA: response regulator transcription factor [Saprospiraceae bacterium]|nr:response regulator transcription factor [Saprospiraceae bacterium]HMQ83584.1 response regulator transcription factor [Saprospiraceae bacterium]